MDGCYRFRVVLSSYVTQVSVRFEVSVCGQVYSFYINWIHEKEKNNFEENWSSTTCKGSIFGTRYTILLVKSQTLEFV